MTTAGLQAKVWLRQAWFESHPDQPVPEARERIEELFATIEKEALRAAAHRPDVGVDAKRLAEAMRVCLPQDALDGIRDVSLVAKVIAREYAAGAIE